VILLDMQGLLVLLIGQAIAVMDGSIMAVAAPSRPRVGLLAARDEADRRRQPDRRC
jgi:hypothetical protein